MTYFIIAGEASGDLHGAGLISKLKAKDASACFVGMGGEHMQKAGCKIVRDYGDMAFMGIIAVLKNIKKIRQNFNIAKNTLMMQRPDVLILIDYPSFNLKIADFCKKHLPDTKIWYYIPPKAWAWKQWRVHKIARLSNRIMCIFPFEVDFYKRYGYEAEYVGNPTKDEIEVWRQNNPQKQADKQIKSIALLPGSRRHEVEKCLPRMLQAARQFPEYQLVIAGAPTLEENIYRRYLQQGEVLVYDNTYNILSEASAAVVNSGTATLETALIGCPQVAVYHIACPHLVALLRPFIFKIPFFTLPNIIADKQVVNELIAYKFTSENIAKELNRLLYENSYREQQLCDYSLIDNLLTPIDH